MGDTMTAMRELLEKVLTSDADDVNSHLRDMNRDFRDRGEYWPVHDAMKAFNGSLDAAKALNDAVLPDRSCGITFGGEYGATITFPPTWDHTSISESNLIPARAWLTAVLRALIAQDA